MLTCRMGWGPGMFFLIFGTFVTYYCARKLAEVSEYKGYRFTTYRHISTAILGASCINFSQRAVMMVPGHQLVLSRRQHSC